MNFLLFDIGGTYFRYAYANEKKILSYYEEKSEDIKKQVLEKIKGNEDRIVIGFAGQIDRKRNRIIFGPNNKARNISFKGKNFILVRDTTLNLIAETFGRKEKNVIYLTLSTGIGCSVMLNGRLVMGKDGNLGEVGHTVINFYGNKLCSCGKKNHAEGYLGGKELERISNEEKIPLQQVLKNKEVVEKYKLLDGYASLIANLINTFDPELIILGGAVYRNNKEFFRKAIEKSKEYVVNRMPKFASAKYNNGIKGAWIIAKNPEILEP